MFAFPSEIPSFPLPKTVVISILRRRLSQTETDDRAFAFLPRRK